MKHLNLFRLMCLILLSSHEFWFVFVCLCVFAVLEGGLGGKVFFFNSMNNLITDLTLQWYQKKSNRHNCWHWILLVCKNNYCLFSVEYTLFLIHFFTLHMSQDMCYNYEKCEGIFLLQKIYVIFHQGKRLKCEKK